jgi:hypothetical protein
LPLTKESKVDDDITPKFVANALFETGNFYYSPKRRPETRPRNAQRQYFTSFDPNEQLEDFDEVWKS